MLDQPTFGHPLRAVGTANISTERFIVYRVSLDEQPSLRLRNNSNLESERLRWEHPR
jgi:hypothetical protein